MTRHLPPQTGLHERTHPATHHLIEAVAKGDERAAAALLLTTSRRELLDLVVHCARLAHETQQRRTELAPHGTHAAFNRHRNAGEEPCQPCRDGEREYQRIRGQQRRYFAKHRHNVAAALKDAGTTTRRTA